MLGHTRNQTLCYPLTTGGSSGNAALPLQKIAVDKTRRLLRLLVPLWDGNNIGHGVLGVGFCVTGTGNYSYMTTGIIRTRALAQRGREC